MMDVFGPTACSTVDIRQPNKACKAQLPLESLASKDGHQGIGRDGQKFDYVRSLRPRLSVVACFYVLYILFSSARNLNILRGKDFQRHLLMKFSTIKSFLFFIEIG